jgi:hypothetical protein
MLGNALAHDILVCDMWANRSLGDHFRREVENAIKHSKSAETEGTTAGLLANFKCGLLTEDQANQYLTEYECHLMSHRSFEPPLTSTPSHPGNGKPSLTVPKQQDGDRSAG